MGLARPYWPHIAGLLLLNLLGPPLALLAPIPLKVAIDAGIGSAPLPRFLRPLLFGAVPTPGAILWLAAGLTLAVALLTQLQGLGVTLLHSYTGERLTLYFRALLFRHAQRLSHLYHDARGSSDAIFRIQYDSPSIQWVAVDGLIPFISASLKVVGMVYVTARIDLQLALVALATAPLLLALSRVYRRRMKQQYQEIKGFESGAYGVLQEVITGVRVVKAFGREDHEERRFVDRSSEGLRARMRAVGSEGALSLLINLTTALGTAAALLIGASKVRSGALTLGELLVVTTYLAQLYGPLQTVGKTVATLQGSLASARRAFELLDQLPEVAERPGARSLRRATGTVEFRGVKFTYDGSHDVLRDVSFAVPAGARVGIAGRTGAGKTTLVSLVMRFIDPTDGQVLLDGVDLRDLRLADLRSQFAIVLQEPVLFSASLAENIAYARPEASIEEIIAAAKAADAHDFITAMPDGYDTRVGERGMRLSGGERQRISLARAFLKGAPVLILDEPTSSVDLKTEAAIMAAMDRLMRGRTAFMIAHRLSTLEGCDILLEIDNGLTTALSPEGMAGRRSRRGPVWDRALGARGSVERTGEPRLEGSS
jgi:ATP-binding cassette subfamily B protein